MLQFKRMKYRDWVSLIMGAAATVTGTSLFNVAEDFRKILFPEYEKLVSTILAIYFTAVSGSALLFTHYNVDNRYCLFTGLIGNAITATLLPLVCFTHNVSFATIFLCILTAFLGIFISLSLTSAIGLGANHTDVDIGSFAAGFGLSGCLSFSFWMLFAHCLFKESDRDSVTYSVSALFLCCVFLSLLNLVQYYLLLRHERQHISESEKTCIMYSSSPLKIVDTHQGEMDMQFSSTLFPSYVSNTNDGDYTNLFKKAWLLLVLRFFSFFETFVIFPYVGPRKWRPTRMEGSLLVGFFQVTDFIGRYTAVCFPQLELSEYGVLYGCVLKWIIIGLSYLTAIYRSNMPFNDFFFRALLIISTAFTNGWFTSCCTICLPRRLFSREGKSRASALGLCLSFIGIATGMWVSMTLSYLIT